MTTDTNTPIARVLTAPLRLGEPQTAHALTVFPLFAGPQRLEYVAFAQGAADGVTAREVASGAVVGDIVVANPLDVGVLLFEGEEVIGAQQNRTFDISVLVAPGATVKVPVSCVEAGRWDGARHGEAFAPAPQAAHPELRRRKNQVVRARAASVDAELRADQSDVWNEVAAKSSRMAASSPTGALHDVFEQRRGALLEIERVIVRHDGQVGALVGIGGRFAVLDLVGRSDVWAALHRPLVQGYALDALEHTGDARFSPEAAERLTALVNAAVLVERPTVGLGRHGRFLANGVAGTALAHEGELVQLSAFPLSGDEQAAPTIRRPSRRRQA